VRGGEVLMHRNSFNSGAPRTYGKILVSHSNAQKSKSLTWL
jgi:hypothetical protein